MNILVASLEVWTGLIFTWTITYNRNCVQNYIWVMLYINELEKLKIWLINAYPLQVILNKLNDM